MISKRYLPTVDISLESFDPHTLDGGGKFSEISQKKSKKNENFGMLHESTNMCVNLQKEKEKEKEKETSMCAFQGEHLQKVKGVFKCYESKLNLY